MSEASAAWLVHWVLLKGMLWVLGIPGAVPFLELAAYAGYAFVPVCISMLAGLALGALPPPRSALLGKVECSTFPLARRISRDMFKDLYTGELQAAQL